jgi:hypothetical protein
MAVIDLTAERAPITVERQLNGSIALKQGENTVTMDDAEIDEFIRMVRPAVTPAKLQRYRMA